MGALQHPRAGWSRIRGGVPAGVLAAVGAPRPGGVMSSRPPRPGDLRLDELGRVGAAMCEALATSHEVLDARRVRPERTPAQAAARFPYALPQEGTPADAILADWAARVVPLLTAVGSPRHFAYVNGSGSMIGMLAD